jgi:hypothetical protein
MSLIKSVIKAIEQRLVIADRTESKQVVRASIILGGGQNG